MAWKLITRGLKSNTLIRRGLSSGIRQIFSGIRRIFKFDNRVRTFNIDKKIRIIFTIDNRVNEFNFNNLRKEFIFDNRVR